MARISCKPVLSLHGVFIALSALVTLDVASISIPEQACTAYIRPGDVTIGGLFSFHSSYNDTCDVGLNYWSVYLAEMMVFAVNRVNQRDDLLPNVTVGFEIREDCVSEDVSLWAALSLVNGPNDADFGDTCSNRNESTTRVHGIIGTAFSFTSILVGKIGSLVQIPIVSYWGTSDELSNKGRFPYFFRTVPPDKFQASAIVDLLLHFDWRYIALLFSIDSYSVHGARQLRSLAESRGICLGLYLPVELQENQEQDDVVRKLKELPKVKVIVVFALADVAYAITKSVYDSDMQRNFTWIGSDGWGDPLEGIDFGPLTHGGIFVRGQSDSVPIFEDYFAQVDPDVDETTPWLASYWKAHKMTENCANVSECPLPLYPFGAAVVDAVDAFAYAFDSLLEEHGDLNFDGQTLRNKLFEVQFETADGRQFQFDSNGDTSGTFAYYNMHKINGDHFELVSVGRWDPNLKDNPLTLDVDSLQFADSTNSTPVSLCEEDYAPGFIVVPLELKCCRGCQKCPDNAIVLNNTKCSECESTFWPNDDFSECIAITPTTLSWRHPIAATLLSCSIFGIGLVLLTIIGVYVHRDHVLIKASSRELSTINITGLLLAFVAVLLLLSTPSNLVCIITEALISFCYTLTYVPTMLKVNRIFRIFQAGKKSVSRPRYVRPRAQVLLALLLIAFQGFLVVLSLVLSPSRSMILMLSPFEREIELYCEFRGGFIASSVYNLLIVITCCYYALRTRKVPSNYNESKFIGISIYSTLLVSLAAVPVYLTATVAVQKIAALCMALLLNAFLTLLVLYLPKLYAIHFVDEDLAVEEWRTMTTSTVTAGNTNQVHPTN